MQTIKELVQNKSVRFTHYQFGDLWYITEDGFKFPVPVSDTGTGRFEATDRAIFFMRYIRKHLEVINGR